MRNVNPILLMAMMLGSQRRYPGGIIAPSGEREKHICPVCKTEHYNNGGFCSPECSVKYKQLRKEGKLP